jgi:hypothetical protein
LISKADALTPWKVSHWNGHWMPLVPCSQVLVKTLAKERYWSECRRQFPAVFRYGVVASNLGSKYMYADVRCCSLFICDFVP